MKHKDRKLYIVMISIHGLVRGHDMELGRDADTGGQILYVVELARALAAHPEVGRVDLLTRRVIDPKVDSDYAEPVEQIAHNAHIVRLECGPRRYLRKEVLWPYLDGFIDRAIHHIRNVGEVPDIIHGHYADAGFAGARLAGLLGVPFVFTGHSLGRVKYERLLERGIKEENIESQYNMSQRIEAEETTLDAAAVVIASTQQEVREQYFLYDNYQPKRMEVIPPGVDLSRFHAPRRGEPKPVVQKVICRFLEDTTKPMILALSRPDERKNIMTLVRAYGESKELQEIANLVIVLGNRDEIQIMEKGPRDVLTQLLMLIDRYDLYGKVAYPKHHSPEEVPRYYRLAARTKGVFVNPALTEPFGLTLIEAAASGLPIIATRDGGPQDIMKFCKNGKLIDPLDADGMAQVLLEALTDRKQWQRWSKSGIRGAHKYFSWPGHAESYVRTIRKLLGAKQRTHISPPGRNRLPTVDRIAISSLDGTLIGDEPGLRALVDRLRHTASRIGFGVATARNLDMTLKALKEWNLPIPDLLISAMGSEIYYGHNGTRLVADHGWHRHIDYRWEPDALKEAIAELPGLKLQPKAKQSEFKISYNMKPDIAMTPREIKRYLRRIDLHANLIYSHQSYLDLLPLRASKGQALRYLSLKWGLPLERFLVVGDSGNDEDMLTGETLAAVVANHSDELSHLRDDPNILFTEGGHAWGVLEAIEYYNFLGEIRIPGLNVE